MVAFTYVVSFPIRLFYLNEFRFGSHLTFSAQSLFHFLNLRIHILNQFGIIFYPLFSLTTSSLLFFLISPENVFVILVILFSMLVNFSYFPCLYFAFWIIFSNLSFTLLIFSSAVFINVFPIEFLNLS